MFGFSDGGRVRHPPVARVGYRMGGRVAGRRRS
jgi:hypothetical protein